MKWTGLNDLRESYLKFFESKGHLRMNSFPLVPQGDASLLLINAGIRHIASNKNIPPFFNGTPAIVIYVAILSIALSCFSGESLFV